MEFDGKVKRFGVGIFNRCVTKQRLALEKLRIFGWKNLLLTRGCLNSLVSGCYGVTIKAFGILRNNKVEIEEDAGYKWETKKRLLDSMVRALDQKRNIVLGKMVSSFQDQNFWLKIIMVRLGRANFGLLGDAWRRLGENKLESEKLGLGEWGYESKVKEALRHLINSSGQKVAACLGKLGMRSSADRNKLKNLAKSLVSYEFKALGNALLLLQRNKAG